MARPQTRWRARTPRTILLLIAITLAAVTTCSARLHEFPEYGISIDIPDTGWVVTRVETPLKKAGGKLLITGSSKKTLFQLIEVPMPVGITPSVEDVRTFIQGLKLAGAEELDTLWESVDGFDALSCSYTMDAGDGKRARMRTIAIMATHNYYALTFGANTSDGYTSPDEADIDRLETGIDIASIPPSQSLRPSASGDADEGERRNGGEEAAYQIGRLFGMMLPIVGVFVLIMYLRDRSRKRKKEEEDLERAIYQDDESGNP